MPLTTYLRSKIKEAEPSPIQLSIEMAQQILLQLEHLNAENTELTRKSMVLEQKYKKCREIRFAQGRLFLDLLGDAEKLWNGQRDDIFACEEGELVWRGMRNKLINDSIDE